jgi:hypothetical protein
MASFGSSRHRANTFRFTNQMTIGRVPWHADALLTLLGW